MRRELEEPGKQSLSPNGYGRCRRRLRRDPQNTHHGERPGALARARARQCAGAGLAGTGGRAERCCDVGPGAGTLSASDKKKSGQRRRKRARAAIRMLCVAAFAFRCWAVPIRRSAAPMPPTCIRHHRRSVPWKRQRSGKVRAIALPPASVSREGHPHHNAITCQHRTYGSAPAHASTTLPSQSQLRSMRSRLSPRAACGLHSTAAGHDARPPRRAGRGSGGSGTHGFVRSC